ncbi:GAF domain-containing protein [Garciella nitratireducens]|uniref:GAF domain-containing protein n=1 Tax=Garciella nitratireducens DSM 15102 TaxID=1121911 RepID=A0A1T4L3P0_9FIRM|nr:GAF domain-containing protein [Garciella nitratireducens]RBP40628.1 GAF domain-containing protein [Garciella nitratireducens]SJZ49171.1 GAF domain-containing protein [Garciella nitratireducens DSM 15102]
MDQKEKENYYRITLKQLRSFIDGEKDYIANTANAAALLFHNMKDINWAGFYFYKEGQLILGPFQGNCACIRIPLGKGVCGSAAKERKTMVVQNVHKFSEHIACDSASNSEIVVPIIKQDRLIGVLDIDSPQFCRFDEIDKKYLEEFVKILNEYCQW